MSLEDYYDIIVVGGGPAGCMAADAAAKENVSILLLEKDREILLCTSMAKGTVSI